MRDRELERVERDVFRKFHEDGLFDIYLGMLLGIMGCATWFTDAVESEVLGLTLYAGLVMFLVGAFTLARRLITKPRLGSFKPGAPRKRKILSVRLVLLGSVIVGLLLFWAFAGAGNATVTFRALMPAIWFVNSMVVFGAMAYFLDLPRMYAYGVLIGLPLAIDSGLQIYADVDVSALLLFAGAGAIIVMVGAYKFVHFLREYPVRADEVGLDGAH